MERRFVAFLVLTLLVWSSFIALRMIFAPPPQAPPADAVVAEVQPGKPEANTDQAAEKSGDAKIPPGENEKPDPAAPAPVAGDLPARPLQHFALGSLDPASPYRMLVTVVNRGAAVERVELNSPKYRAVEDYGGYLGHLSLADANAGGAEVGVVGPGTPAALAKTSAGQAGLATGDIIQRIDDQPIDYAKDVESFLQHKARPGQRVTISVRRAGKDQPLSFTTELTRTPLEIVRPESHQYPGRGGMPIQLPVDPLSLLVKLENIGGRALRSKEEEIAGLPSLKNSNWELASQGSDFVELSLTLDEAALAKIGKPGKLKITKRFTLAKANQPGEAAYHLDLQVAVQNLAAEPQTVAYRLQGPTGLPLEGWWYSTKLSPNWSGAGARDIVYKQAGLGHKLMGCPRIVSDTVPLEKEGKPPLLSLLTGDQAAAFDYVGVDTQFFASAILPQPLAGDQLPKFQAASALAVQEVTAIPKNSLRTADVSFQLATSPQSIDPGSSLRHEYRVFFGPKDPAILADYELDAFIEYGWRIFAVPAILLHHVLSFLYWLTAAIGMPNYGIAIILLTVIVRSCMIPVSLKQARSAAKMQELAPEIQKIKDKFPDDPMKQHAAVQELYKKHDFNMFAGCLPVFIQLPIFIGLYRCLSVNIDLRDAAFLPGLAWASNLAGPDKLFYWKDWVFAIICDEADGYLGPYFNVLPLITVALFLVQQKMFTPPATDDQTKMQQQMMTYMTVIMGVMFYKVPAGLCLYFITSSLWGIAERKLLPKSQLKKEGADAAVALPAKPAGANGSAKAISKGAALRKQRRR